MQNSAIKQKDASLAELKGADRREPTNEWLAYVNMDRNTGRLLRWGLAPETGESYATAQQSYYHYCIGHTTKPHLPVTSFKLIKWITHLHDRSVRPKFIKKYLNGLRMGHVNLGNQDLKISRFLILKRMTNGIKIGKVAKPMDDITCNSTPHYTQIISFETFIKCDPN